MSQDRITPSENKDGSLNGKPQPRPWSVNMDNLAPNHPMYRGLRGIPGTGPLTQEQRAASLASIKDKPTLLEKKGKH